MKKILTRFVGFLELCAGFLDSRQSRRHSYIERKASKFVPKDTKLGVLGFH